MSSLLKFLKLALVPRLKQPEILTQLRCEGSRYIFSCAIKKILVVDFSFHFGEKNSKLNDDRHRIRIPKYRDEISGMIFLPTFWIQCDNRTKKWVIKTHVKGYKRLSSPKFWSGSQYFQSYGHLLKKTSIKKGDSMNPLLYILLQLMQ